MSGKVRRGSYYILVAHTGCNIDIACRKCLFVTQEVVEKILFRYLPGTNKNKLKKCGTMEKLMLFVREAIKVHFITYNIEGIKELDNITVNCKMPSRSGKDIASKLHW